ncbi:ankyrin repeat protein, putative [Trichomonas vaginalis G3]|uniref:Ankyrin repeat protein, putative n=1 Tax=Trichomonas vaginalis (strain ATCC PRA-98 / G3) TaxID=412133 RepID=A2FMP2_TRIV3|nr:spectrin binding [Trichomonas vaginalis G3]EAX93842.1 ankyrin repeat protein, putative [Trichomonas vaginalis G3]KAI5490914.1 spectrin binding [Trichomonas vaginalis G3]|eukprot:XP_001306772.1 ankyrin repeat protein [Trichomonas vaginalis G3]
MEDNLESFIFSTERDDFDESQRLISDLYAYFRDGYSLLELCCYHGSVNCFKLLISKFQSLITQKCLQLSFLSGKKEIMSECLKFQTPDILCMKNAIMSHNIDFVTFLMYEYKMEIDLFCCGEYYNPHALLVYLDQTHNIDNGLAYSPLFNNVKLCQYLISHGADVNAKDQNGRTVLHSATWFNKKEIAELLILNGADINAKYYDEETPLHKAVSFNNREIAELLISHGADLNAKNDVGETPLQKAKSNEYKEMEELLISKGAKN